MKKVYIGNSVETKSICIKIDHKKFYYYDFNIFENEVLQNQKCQVVGNTYLKKYKEPQPLKLICFGKGYSVFEKKKNQDKIVGYIEVNEGKYIRVLRKRRHWISQTFFVLVVVMCFIMFCLLKRKTEQLFNPPYPSRIEMEQHLQ